MRENEIRGCIKLDTKNIHENHLVKIVRKTFTHRLETISRSENTASMIEKEYFKHFESGCLQDYVKRILLLLIIIDDRSPFYNKDNNILSIWDIEDLPNLSFENIFGNEKNKEKINDYLSHQTQVIFENINTIEKEFENDDCPKRRIPTIRLTKILVKNDI
jgi:hypothetical protein